MRLIQWVLGLFGWCVQQYDAVWGSPPPAPTPATFRALAEWCDEHPEAGDGPKTWGPLSKTTAYGLRRIADALEAKRAE